MLKEKFIEIVNENLKKVRSENTRARTRMLSDKDIDRAYDYYEEKILQTEKLSSDYEISITYCPWGITNCYPGVAMGETIEIISFKNETYIYVCREKVNYINSDLRVYKDEILIRKPALNKLLESLNKN